MDPIIERVGSQKVSVLNVALDPGRAHFVYAVVRKYSYPLSCV